ncbi:polysaccharide deacetylase family protein [Rhodanobacter sp. C01]|uniref:polysaccharide deacetylase family protein n=1 Tax=Rhodanobacter sp. C01 TaxID=1945856 RepID=UPI000986AF44|nr:polysaccharide deacetylase family protein [Rhodanobacter sp. C01]OOG50986.1 polysaccharide deacetylase [Rhodanobacter sp. C01]
MNLKPKKQQLLGLLPNALVQTHGPRRGNVRFLSFDDGPHPEYTPRLLDLLAESGAHASFFVVGRKAELYPAVVERIVAEGHLLGNHSFWHHQFAQMSLHEQVAELDRTDEVLAAFDQCPLHRIRPPQGCLTMPLLLHLARRRRSVAYWSYDSLDYQHKSGAELAARMHKRPPIAGDIVLMHDDSDCAGEALSTLLPQWRASGHEFRALSPEAA